MDKKQKGGIMADKEIKIKISKDQKKITHITSKKVQNGDQVRWICEDGHIFTVDFGWASPFSETSYKGEKLAGSANSETTDNTVMANASAVGYPLRFKYTVAVLVNNEILISDPEVIIDP